MRQDYQRVIDNEQSKLKKFKISYFYLATGMEGVPDIYPEKIIEAPTKELAVYIYHLMFMAATDLRMIESIKSYNGGNYAFQDFETFLRSDDSSKYWGTSVETLV